jgi:hypothetical protein
MPRLATASSTSVPAICVKRNCRSPPSSGGPNCTSVPVVDWERQIVSPLAERISA